MKYLSEKHNPDIQAQRLPAPVARLFWSEKWHSYSKRLVLLDLDGTVLDTAGDLGDAANQLRKKRGLDSLDLALYRPEVSRGARGMISIALNKNWNDPDFEHLRVEFLEAYYKNLLNKTDFIPGMDRFLVRLTSQNITWGIVTNKYKKYARPIIEGIKLLRKNCSVLVCGDSTSHAKPHPEPVLHARRLLNFAGEETIYIGDDPRDIQSGYNAGCWTHAVNFFCEDGGKPHLSDWGSDDFSTTAAELGNKLGVDLA